MKLKWLVLAGAAALLVNGFGGSPAEAAKRKYYQRGSMNYSYMAGPRTRVYVTRRSWLDAGTEVLPGERKFTDYAIPPGSSIADQLDPRGGFRRQPLPDPWDLPGSNKW